MLYFSKVMFLLFDVPSLLFIYYLSFITNKFITNKIDKNSLKK